MNINDKIAARRKEVEQERQLAAAEEIVRRQAELEAQQEAIRLANSEVVVSDGEKQKTIEMPAYMIAPAINSIPDEPVVSKPNASAEASIINECLERVTKMELFIFLLLAALSIFNIFRGELGRTLFFSLFALIYIAYILNKHRDEVVALAREISTANSKEI